jgi:hypothetical protein
LFLQEKKYDVHLLHLRLHPILLHLLHLLLLNNLLQLLIEATFPVSCC